MKKLIVIILAIAMFLTLIVPANGESYQDYAARHSGSIWLPEDLYDLDLENDIDIEAITPYNLYPSVARVVEISIEEDILILFDGYNQWILEGIEDFQVGDLVSLLMFDNFTGTSVEDDIIILCWYAGNI